MNAEQQLMGAIHAAAVNGILEKLRAELPAMLEMHPLIAELQYARYSSLMKAGFSQEQAMFLLTSN